MLLQELEVVVLAKLNALRGDVLLILFALVELIPKALRLLKTGLLWFVPRSPQS
jgi:hypothetical protein